MSDDYEKCGKKAPREMWDLNAKCIRPKGHKGICTPFFKNPNYLNGE